MGLPDGDSVLSYGDCGILGSKVRDNESRPGRRMEKNMGNDYKSETRKQYLRYFRFWFIAVAI